MTENMFYKPASDASCCVEKHQVKFGVATDKKSNRGVNVQIQHVSCFHFACLTLIAVTLAGCETMSKEECRSADWFEVGYQDGRDGKARAQIEHIAESCAKANIAPDRERYFHGRDKGLFEYCTPEHGFYLGKNGTSYNRVCPPGTTNVFEAAYNDGRRVYEARQKLKKLEASRHELEDRLSKATADEEKKHIRDELEDMDKRLRFARDTLQFIENESRHFH